ncbi:MAG: hypothetical protein WD969_01585 [Paracoccaceae bacterium]
MSFVVDLLKKPPKLEDVGYVVHALLTRPLDLPGILRREAAIRRAGKQKQPPPDSLGLHCVTMSWQAALEAGVFEAPPGAGPHLTVPRALVNSPLSVVSALQSASGVTFLDLEDDPVFPVLSLEAARLGLPQSATNAKRAEEARRAYLETAEMTEPLRAALRALASQPIQAA